jgi:hypothetical protein
VEKVQRGKAVRRQPLDQGMIMAAIANELDGDDIRQSPAVVT